MPDTVSLTGVDNKYLKEALVATLYRVGKLSEKEARQVLGLTRRAFEDLLPRFGFSILADDKESTNAELQELLRTGRINTRIYEALAVEIRTA